jgi:hypothetical protein
LILCRVHIKRAFRKKFGSHPATSVIDLAFASKSKSEVLKYFNEASTTWPETANWFKNKQHDWLLAGLTGEASRIPIQWWTMAPHHTGICESSHFVDNEAIGRKNSLLGAILK